MATMTAEQVVEAFKLLMEQQSNLNGMITKLVESQEKVVTAGSGEKGKQWYNLEIYK